MFHCYKYPYSSVYMSESETYFIWEALKGAATRGALLGGPEAADDVLESGCHYKVLLLETELLSFKELQHRLMPRGENKVTDQVLIYNSPLISLGQKNGFQ